MSDSNTQRATHIAAVQRSQRHGSGSLQSAGSPFFVFDVESVGLHGEGFAVAGGVYLANGAAQWEFGYCCPIDEAKGDDEGRKWVKENVPTLKLTHRVPRGIRSAFWLDWLKAKAQSPNVVMAAECAWPVEARFLCAVIDDEPEERMWKGPYPLHEIATYLAAAGMNPMIPYPRTPSELPAHNPLPDARLSARLLAEALARMGNNEVSGASDASAPTDSSVK